MKVLVMAPPGDLPDQITPHSFIDEEIEGISALGVEMFVLSPAIREDASLDSIRLIALPPSSWNARLAALRLMCSYPSLIPGPAPRIRHTLHSFRIEAYAARIIREHSIDVIHSHFGTFLGLGGMVARAITGRPLVATFRGMDLLMDPTIEYGLRRDRFYDRAVRKLLVNADVTTYASGFMRTRAVEMGADPDRAITISKGVDLEAFHVVEDREALKRSLGVEGGMILSVAGLIPRKGLDILIRAFAALPGDLSPTLVICGEGPSRDDLMHLAAQLDVLDRVEFRGQVGRAEISRFFSACDVFVLPSLLEAAGNVILEAMASGRPVISTLSGGPEDYVRNGRTGFLVEPGDALALGGRLEDLLRDPELRERMGRAGRQVAERAHPYADMVRGFRNAYDKACDLRR